MLLLLAIIEALTFSLTLSQDRVRATLRYPTSDGIQWVLVCVESEGHGDAEKGQDPYPWYQNSCWEPRFLREEYRLRPDAYHVRAHLTIDQNGKRSVLSTPVMQVRPEPTRIRSPL